MSLGNAPVIQSTTHNAPFPASSAMGWTLVAGTYDQTTEDVYQGGSPTSAKHHVIVLDTTAGALYLTDDGNGSVKTTPLTYAASGAMITVSLACGGSVMEALGYTATPTGLVMYDPVTKRVETYAKQ